ncbi:MAG: UDP-2,3-diacylglucosamine diphosphatase [Gemmatimonadota bacterium]|nr:UDP-2,3-diacylglucosamine diphosphatase [Gemmatimonadota bacterium]
MLASPCYVISDTHLGLDSAALERQVASFLRHLQGRAGSLLINGDLFDFWFEWRSVVPRGNFRTLGALAELRDEGVDVMMIGGNHDCWGGDVLRKDVGLSFHLGEWEGRLGGWQAHVEHGDGLRPEADRKYRMLRRVLRHPLSVAAFRWVHPDWGTRLARGSSTASRAHQPADEGEGLRRIAHERLANHRGTELVVFGHSHRATLERGPHGVYANPGSWLDAPTFLLVRPERIELRSWSGSTEGDLLHAVDRGSEEALTET